MNIEIVATSGCFDVLTPGHVDFLRRARSMGDMLVVLLNSDESITRLKGQGRPINPMWHRIMVLRELRCVDLVIPFSENTPSEALIALKPEWYVKGSEYAEESIPEAELLPLWGGHLVFLPRKIEISTTETLLRLSTVNPTLEAPQSALPMRENNR